MPDTAWLTDLFVCPRCRHDLSPEKLTCPACETTVPQPGKLPWVFRDPDAARAAWAVRYRQFAASMRRDSEQLAHSLQAPGLPETTRQRLETLRQAYAEQVTLVTKLLQPLGFKAPERGQRADDALAGQLPRSQNLLSYFDNIHRDWCWQDSDENTRAADILAELIGPSPSALTLLGAGSGRLAFDLHAALAPPRTVAIDLNPLMLYAARRLLNGQSVELYEFPLAPIDEQHLAVKHKVKRKAKAPRNLHLVAADITENPFRAGSLETVITPWLIDIVDIDLRDLATLLNAAMAPGGRWINHGSLVFNQADPSRQYLYDEVRAIVHDSGFTLRAERFDELPYLNSPASNQRRVERVWSFVAEKTAARDAPALQSHLPGFLQNAEEPIPQTPYFQHEQISHTMLAPLLALIDGQHTLQDLAAYLSREYAMDAGEALHYARKLLVSIYERNSGRGVFG